MNLFDIYPPVLWRALLATLLGLAIGWERRASGSSPRARIIALVAMTTAAMTALCSHVIQISETSRVLQGLLTGIGFLGAGVIMRDNRTGEVRGLTTAACLWTMSVVGIIVGAGHEILGILVTLIVYVVIAWDEWPLVTRLRERRAKQKAVNSGAVNSEQ